MSTEHDLEQRLRAAAPASGSPPDVTDLWRKAQSMRWTRHVVGAAVVGLLAVAVVGALAFRPTVELAPGASAAGQPEDATGPHSNSPLLLRTGAGRSTRPRTPDGRLAP